MNRKRLPIDERPGRLPEIHTEGTSVTFGLPLDDFEGGLRLVLRCDPDGNVWASIVAREPGTK
jgi:hypothetical protein